MKRHFGIIFIGLTLILGFSELFPVWWYHLPPKTESRQATLKWTVPENARDYKLSESVAGKILSYDKGIQILDTDDHRAIGITYLEYEKGNERMLSDLYFHSPEICFANAGAELLAELPAKAFVIADQELKARHWLFKDPISGSPLHAFKVIWSSDIDVIRQTLSKGDLGMARLRAALERRKLGSARMILAVTSGVLTEDDAWNVFEDTVISRLSVEELSPGK